MKIIYKYIKYVILFIGIIFGQYYQTYGKNIVQYDNFNWNYIQTQHFDIYTYSPGDDHANLVAKESEEAYQKLSDLLKWRLKNRVSIIIYNSHNDFQQTNVVKQYMQEGIGGVTELYKNRVVIPFDGSLIEFRDVLHHELLHAFINDCVYGGSIREKIARSIQFSIPHWMNEGLAEYSSNTWDTNSDMWMRDLTINNNQLLNINQLNGYLGYRGGQSVWRFITSKWGDESISEIIVQIKSKKNVNQGIKEAIGLDMKALNSQWKDYLKETYWDEIGLRKNINEFARQLTNHEDWGNNYNIAPSISPNGGKIAILSNKDGPMSIYLISADNGKIIKKIVTGERNSEYEELHILKPGITWSPDGNHIAFSAKSGNSDVLYIINASTYKREKIELPNIEGVFRPSWSPKGDKIAFIGNNGKSSDVYIYDRLTKEISAVTNDWYSEDHVSWFPDGDKLIFISDRGDNLNGRDGYFDNQLDIYSLSLGTQNIIRLTDTPYNESYPVISSDNKTIAYISDQSGINNIYLTDNNFLKSYPITNIMTGITQLSWNGDDTQLIFTGFYKMGYDIFTLSNPKELIGSIDAIQPSKWKLENNKIDLVRKDSVVTVVDNTEDKYRNYILIDEQNIIEDIQIEESEESFKDSNNNYIVNNYKPRFTLDYANYGVNYNYMVGNRVMANFIFSDILGDYNFYISTETVLTLNASDYYFVFNNLKDKIDKTYYLYQDVREQYNYTSEEAYRIRENGFLINFSYPFSKFIRLEYGFNINYKEHNTITFESQGWYNEEITTLNSVQTSLEPSIRYVSDHVYWQKNTVSGYRSSIEYIYSHKVLSSDSLEASSFNRLMTDNRYYKSLFNGVSFAFRFYGGTTWNWDNQIISDQNKFYLGGSPCIGGAWDCNASIPFTMMFDEESIMPLRGIDVYSKSGTNVMLYNFELRLPFLIYYFPAIQFLGQINGAIFCDIGTTWNWDDGYKQFSDESSWRAENTYPGSTGWAMSYGFGPRFMFLGLPWQIDFTWEYNPHIGTITDRKTFLRIFPEF